MKRAFAISGMLPLLLALAACDQGPPEVGRIAHQSMLGLSKKKVLGCLGAPARRVAIGSDEIWTYSSGYRWTEGPVWAIGLDLGAPPYGPGGSCDVNLTMVDSAVGQVAYSLPDGRELPIGQQCVFAVERCARAR